MGTPGMKKRILNESQVLRELPSFFDSYLVMSRRFFCSENKDCHHQKYKSEYIRTTRLIFSCRYPMISDSPDALLCVTGNDVVQHFCAVEIKTMTSLNTVDASRE